MSAGPMSKEKGAIASAQNDRPSLKGRLLLLNEAKSNPFFVSKTYIRHPN
jgi:hypothetical protein